MRFKKATSLFLAILLLVSNLGLAFNVHFCEGRIVAVTTVFNVEEVCEMPQPQIEKSCCKEAALSHKKCCDDKVVDLQDAADQIVVKTFSLSIAAPFIAVVYNPVSFVLTPVIKSDAPADYYCESNAPPLFQLYSQLIFYA